ncbi:zinc-finger homeodomain protein 1 [Beta vulgaris subsp. vulgaris]|uniref:zinc-finger homeodomain protein 1 n=1 Tax=Beta vulgaris subsp. vulgaris TaxID=3555 RepID=UPI00053FBA8B|nr:zinc-finger homeodomain protein 1 [Beta vulgaris subsp. vulgaris]
MEFEDEHDEEQEEEDEDEDEITIPPPPPQPAAIIPPSYDSITGGNSVPSRPRVNPPSGGGGERRSSAVRYRECLKNHAVNIGGHAVDGCGEFMAAGAEGSLDALKCAACNCHRNFHRKETDTNNGDNNSTMISSPPIQSPAAAAAAAAAPASTMYPQFSAYYRTPAPPASAYHQQHQHQHQHPHSHHMRHHYSNTPLAALPSTSGGTHSGDMADDMSHPSSSGGDGRRESGGGGGGGGGSAMMMVPKKRHRTKFSQEQKDKMLAFAEKLGWRIQKHDEAAVQQFCAEVQVKRQVLKVWMHNNKHTLGR